MIVIENVGATSPSRQRRRQSVRKLQWGVLLVLMILIYGSHAPLITLTKVEGHIPFSSSSCVVMIELTKLAFSLSALLLTGGDPAMFGAPSVSQVAPYAIPAALYALNNNLVVVMQAYMDPSSFQVLSNLKIAATALLYSSCLGRRLRRAQWAAVGLLTGAGTLHSYSSLDGDEPEEETEGRGLYTTAWGLVLVLLYCFVSGLAAVYTEKVLKSQKLPLSLQNLYLYTFGVAINVLAIGVAGERSFLEGFSWLVWAIVAAQAANGLLMSVVLKHGSGITRLFVISCSMLVNAVLSWAVFGLRLTPSFLLPVSMIALAAHLYYS